MLNILIDVCLKLGRVWSSSRSC